MNVAHQQGGDIGGGGKPHVGKVAVAQVDFSGASGTLDDYQLGGIGHAAETVKNGRHELCPGFEILARRHRGLALALNDDLRTGGGLGLQQHRVHVDGELCPRGAGLQRLGAANFAAIGGDSGIVRHVLWLEGTNRQPPPRVGPAQARHNEGFADIGAGAHQHDGAGHLCLQIMLPRRSHAHRSP